jgi:iron complex transport system substrate-binding protein
VDARLPALRARRALATLAVAILLGACTSTPAATPLPSLTPLPSTAPSAVPSAAPTEAPTPAPTASPAAAMFPVTVTDDEGTAVTIAAQPTKIVSLMPSVTETLFALGVGDQVVGKAQDIFLYPPQASAVPDFTQFDKNYALVVDTERILAAKTDLVIAAGNGGTPAAAIDQLRGLGVTVIVVYAPNVAGVLSDISLIGRAVGRSAEARAITNQMKDGMDAVSAAVKDAGAPRVYYETGEGYGIADQSFTAEMITLAGGTPITTGSTTKWDMPAEKILAANPDIVLLADGPMVTVADAIKRPGWSTMTAVKSNAVAVIDDTTISRPGPRLFLGLELLAAAIHPDVTIPQASPVPAVP